MSDVAPPSSPLQHVPVTMFASVMGVAGLGLAARKAAGTLGLPAVPGEAILAIAALLFVAVSVAYAAKLVRFGQAVAAEFNHPVRSTFFSALPIAVLLLATGLEPHHRGGAQGLWMVGTALQLIFTIRILSRWIVHKHDIGHANPAWFIPVVGNIIVPILGVRLGLVETSWFFFSIGILFWVPLLAIVLYRVIFHDDLPPRLVPTLFILVPPPAVGYLSYVSLAGHEDAFALVLVNAALFTTLVLLALAPRFMRLPFALSWWAFTFPLDAMALAALEHGHRAASPLWSGIGVVVLGLAAIVVAVVAGRTLTAMARGTLFVPE